MSRQLAFVLLHAGQRVGGVGGGATPSLPVNVAFAIVWRPPVSQPCVCVCVCLRDGGFLHGDLRSASALPGGRRTKGRQRLALRRRVENKADWHLPFRHCLPHKWNGAGLGLDRHAPSVLPQVTLFFFFLLQVGRRPACRASRPQPPSGQAPPGAT